MTAPNLMAFGSDVLVFNSYNPPAAGEAFTDELGTYSPLPQVAGSPASVPGCRHRPFRSATRGGAGAAESQYPEPGVGIGINWWQSTCPPHPAALAAKASDTITCGSITYRIIDDARPFNDAAGQVVKVTFLSEIEEPIA